VGFDFVWKVRLRIGKMGKTTNSESLMPLRLIGVGWQYVVLTSESTMMFFVGLKLMKVFLLVAVSTPIRAMTLKIRIWVTQM
jgi:hypothetical protein